MLSYLGYRLSLFIIGLIPMSFLYLISNVLRFFFEHVIRYRRKVIDQNLNYCFPHYTETETSKIRHSFYKNLSDITVESLKGMTISAQEIKANYSIKNKSVVSNYLDKGNSVMIVGAHMTNWEWAAVSFGIDFPDKAVGIYKHIKNSRIAEDVLKRRGSSGLTLISTKETRRVHEYMKLGKLFIFATDQSPSNVQEAIWVDFFNIKTACLHGFEKYSLEYNLPVIFCDMYRLSRGKYEYNFFEIWDGKTEVIKGELTQRFMNSLEEKIKLRPSDWLWSHKRWKHKWDDFAKQSQ